MVFTINFLNAWYEFGSAFITISYICPWSLCIRHLTNMHSRSGLLRMYAGKVLYSSSAADRKRKNEVLSSPALSMFFAAMLMALTAFW